MHVSCIILSPPYQSTYSCFTTRRRLVSVDDEGDNETRERANEQQSSSILLKALNHCLSFLLSTASQAQLPTCSLLVGTTGAALRSTSHSTHIETTTTFTTVSASSWLQVYEHIHNWAPCHKAHSEFSHSWFTVSHHSWGDPMR